MACRTLVPVLWGLFAFAVGGCGTDTPQATNRFVSSEFKFEISVPQEFSSAGWFLIREEDSALPHQYQPPSGSDWEPVAVVVPPTESYPLIAPFFVDIFRLPNLPTTAKELGDIRAGQVGESLRSRTSLVIDGTPAEEITHWQGNEVLYETYLTREVLGYAIHALGAPDTSGAVPGFTVDSEVYRGVIQTFRFRE